MSDGMTFADFKKRGLLRAIQRAFTSERRSREALEMIGFPPGNLPPFGSASAFWTDVCRDIDQGAAENNGLETLLAEAARQFPSNPAFAPYLRNGHSPRVEPEPAPPTMATPVTMTTAPPTSPTSSSTPTVSVQFDACSDAAALVDAARAAAARFQIRTDIEMGYVLGTIVCLHFDANAETALRIANAAVAGRDELGSVAIVHRFADRLFDRLFVEGPDQGRFELNQVPASTRVHEIAKAMATQYSDAMWPRDREGRVRPSVVDRLRPDGTTERMRPDSMLHDNDVQEGETFHVSSESTAGAVHPRIRDEALARVRTQILAYNAGHPDFEVFADASQMPTDYVFRFHAPGWGPPPDGQSAPIEVDEHDVFLSLPPDFPMAAPIVLWRSPRFHPNIRASDGFVCLGELADGYRPGMDFGELCDLLVEIAAYRNYELSPTLNKKAAVWAGSASGQREIGRRGGRMQPPRKDDDENDEDDDEKDRRSVAPPLRIKRVQ